MGVGTRSLCIASTRLGSGVARSSARPAGATRRRGSPRPARRPSALLLVALLLPAATVPAAAQEFGQWSWEALVALGGLNRDSLRAGESGSTYDERITGLSGSMNGFIVHPAISRFRLGADLQFIETDSGQTLDTTRSGLEGSLELFPRGAYRGSLRFHRQLYDYSGGAADDPFALLASPDTLTTYSGRFRAARGFLKGSLLGFDHNTVAFVEPGTDDQINEREFYDWARKIGTFSHHVRVEHRYREIGTVDVNYDELRMNIDERGDFTPDAHWTLAASGVSQNSESFGLGEQTLQDYQLRTRLTHDVRERDLLEYAYEFGRTEFDTRPASDSHGLLVSYRWRPNLSWQLGPLVSYARVDSDTETTRAPRAGLIVGWDRAWEAWNSGFLVRGSYGALKREVAGMSQDENQFAGSFIGNVGHGSVKTLRKELEVEWTRNRLRITQAGPIVPPGLGLPLPGLGTEDLQRARVMLGHQWDSMFLNAWGDWTRRETDALTASEDLTSETLTATLQYGTRRFDVRGNVADSEVEDAAGGSQSIRTYGLLASWRPWRTVTLRGSYRFDNRNITLAPDIEGTQIEAGVRWQVGYFYLDTSYLETKQELAGSPETTLRAVTWKISRRFGGYLPIVSGPARRGVIR